MWIRRHGSRFLIHLAALFVLGCDRKEPASPSTTEGGASHTLFVDVTAAANLDFVHDPAATGDYWIPEINGSGGAWLDVDNDGDLDLYLIQSGQWSRETSDAKPNRLFRNDVGIFTDITAYAGAGDLGYGMGCCVADVDNDGDTDVYITNVGPNVLLINDGTARFVDRSTEAGVADPGFGESCSFIDHDRDGDLDLYVTNYVHWTASARDKECHDMGGLRDYCSPLSYDAPAGDVLYRNRGDGTFEDVTQSSRVSAEVGTGLGVVCGDLNDDGWPDLYVANDKMPNTLWINQRDGTYRNEASTAAVAVNLEGVAEASMGIDLADVDDDGDLDIFVTHLAVETHTFYRQRRPGRFRDETAQLKINRWSLPFTGFGTAFLDYDHDGRLDLFVANGKVFHGSAPIEAGKEPYGERNQLLHGEPDGSFTEVKTFDLEEVSRGALIADYDNDGDLDILVTNNRGPARLLRNDAPKAGRWLIVRATTGDPPRDALGAAVFLETGQKRYRREIRSAGGYLGGNDPRAHFTLPEGESPDALVIRWPDGREQRMDAPALDQHVTVHQSAGATTEP